MTRGTEPRSFLCHELDLGFRKAARATRAFPRISSPFKKERTFLGSLCFSHWPGSFFVLSLFGGPFFVSHSPGMFFSSSLLGAWAPFPLPKSSYRCVAPSHGCGSKLSQEGTAGFSLWFHLPGFHFGYLFLTHSHMASWRGDP